MCLCGAETIAALTPGGRVVDLDVDHVWVKPDERWPRCVFILGVAGGNAGPAVPHATPALELCDGDIGRPSGPFRREHLCTVR